MCKTIQSCRNRARVSHKVRKFCRGGALISALFITALAAMLAVALAMQQRLLIHQGNLMRQSDQAYLDLQSDQLSAKQAILDYVNQWASNATPSQLLPMQQVLHTTIISAQGKFNLNNLQYVQNQSAFVALLCGIDTEITPKAALTIAQSITAWITTGTQDPYYLSLKPAYRSSETQLVDVSELRLIAGITPDIYAKLKPYVIALPLPAFSMNLPANSALPAGLPIDINAVSAPVLLTLSPTLNINQADRIVACRKAQGGFTSTGLFMTDCVQPLGITLSGNVTATSQYFLVNTEILIQQHPLILSSLMVTEKQKNNTLKVVTVWQSFV